MRSIPLALTWEMGRRGRWSLLAAGLGTAAFSALLLAALRHEGPLQASDPVFIIMQVVLMQLNAFVFGAAVLETQGGPARWFAYPVNTATLVFWRLLLAMGAVLLHALASTALLNAVFDLRWPLWGPALFLAVAAAVIQAVLWLADRSAWLPVAVAGAGAILGLWFKSRSGPVFSMPDHYWREVTAGELATLVAAAGLAYGVGIVAFARNRRGEPPLSLGVMTWLPRWLHSTPRGRLAFRSPAHAQSWSEWRQKGWAMPATVAFGMLLGCGAWLIFSRDPKELYAGFITGGGLLSLAGLVGAILIGNAGSGDAQTEIGPFLATRPLTTADLAWIILKMAAGSVLLAWMIWAAAFLMLYVVLRVTDSLPRNNLDDWAWWYLPATLLGAWTVTTVGASISLIGRPGLFVKAFCGLIVAYAVLVLFARYGLSPRMREWFAHGLTVAVGVACVLGTAWVYLAAHRQALVGGLTLIAAASVWAGLSIVAAALWTQHPAAPFSLAVLLIGLGALVVAPLAAAPLTLFWNRVR